MTFYLLAQLPNVVVQPQQQSPPPQTTDTPTLETWISFLAANDLEREAVRVSKDIYKTTGTSWLNRRKGWREGDKRKQ